MSHDIRTNRTIGQMGWEIPTMSEQDKSPQVTIRRADGQEVDPSEAEQIQAMMAEINQKAMMLLQIGIPAEVVQDALNDTHGEMGQWKIIMEPHPEDEDTMTVKLQLNPHLNPDEQ